VQFKPVFFPALRTGSTRRHHSHIPHKPAFPGAVYEPLHPGQGPGLFCSHRLRHPIILFEAWGSDPDLLNFLLFLGIIDFFQFNFPFKLGIGLILSF